MAKKKEKVRELIIANVSPTSGQVKPVSSFVYPDDEPPELIAANSMVASGWTLQPDQYRYLKEETERKGWLDGQLEVDIPEIPGLLGPVHIRLSRAPRLEVKKVFETSGRTRPAVEKAERGEAGVTATLRDRTLELPFTHKIGQRIRHIKTRKIGWIVDGQYKSARVGDGAYKLTYEVKFEDGTKGIFRDVELEELAERESEE